MNKNLILGLILMSSPLAYSGVGNEGGGGGGGICIGSHCQTLAEAGVKLKSNIPTDTQQYWVPTSEIKQHLSQIRQSLPFQGMKNRLNESLGHYKTFVIVESVSQKLMSEVTREYKDILSRNNQSVQNLTIFAITENSKDTDRENRKTFLLPSFFKLSSRQQSLVLIHEAGIRNRESLESVLRLDNALNEFLSGKDPSHYNYLDLVAKLELDITQLSTEVLKYLSRKAGRPLVMEDFVDESAIERARGFLDGKESDLYSYQSGVFLGNNWQLSQKGKESLIRGNQTIDSRFSDIFETSTVYLQQKKDSQGYTGFPVETQICETSSSRNPLMLSMERKYDSETDRSSKEEPTVLVVLCGVPPVAEKGKVYRTALRFVLKNINLK